MTNDELERLATECGAVKYMPGEWRFNAHRLREFARLVRESAQRERMAARFADRPKTPASADFDLPS